MRYWSIRPIRLGLLALLVLVLFLQFSPEGQQWLIGMLGGGKAVSKLRYVCPLFDFSATQEEADCLDCTYYPVDKAHRLAATYRPPLIETDLPGGGLVAPIAREPLRQLFAAANKEGLSPVVTSAYRSYEVQEQTFQYWLFQEWWQTGDLIQAGRNAARYSARAGRSEHQLGTAVDVNCKGCVAFDDQDRRNIKLWQFLEANAHRFGFVISYPRNMEERTGYQYEPWHIRYVGKELATALFDEGYLEGNGVCLLALLQAEGRY